MSRDSSPFTVTVNPAVPADASWGTVPNIPLTRGTPASYNLPSLYATNYLSNTEDVVQAAGTAIPAQGVTMSADGVISYDGTGSGSFTFSGVQLNIVDTVVPGAWAARSTAAGVIWAHNFSEGTPVNGSTPEVENFIRAGEFNTNPDPTSLPLPITLNTTPFGTSRSLVTQARGTAITQAIPQVNKGATQVINVGDASIFPQPGGSLSPYSIFIGCAAADAQNTNPEVFEVMTLMSRNTTNNTITVVRTSESNTIRVQGVDYLASSPFAPAVPLISDLYRIGFKTSGSWNRPFAAFPATQNGKATADIGTTNGSARKTRTWDATRGGIGHSKFREAYFGSKYYWDTATNPAAPFKDWTPEDPGNTTARVDAFEGDEFYLQFRAKISAARFLAPVAKFFFIQNAGTSGTGQFFYEVGGQHWDETPPNPVAGVTYGRLLTPETAYGNSPDAPAEHTLTPTGQRDGAADRPNESVHQGYALCYYNNRVAAGGSGMKCWCYPADRWVTYLIHMKLGRDNAEPLINNGTYPRPYTSSTSTGSSYQWRAPQPPPSSDFYSLVEVMVADEGDTTYKTLVSRSDFLWCYGDGKDQAGYYYYNAPGLNTFWMTQELNMYVGSGSIVPPNGSHSIEYTEAILSRNPIPVPA